MLNSWGGFDVSSTSPGLWHSVQGFSGWEKSNLWSWMLYRSPEEVRVVT